MSIPVTINAEDPGREIRRHRGRLEALARRPDLAELGEKAAR